MKCPSCGADVAENVVICHACGTRLEAEIETPSEPANAPEGGPNSPGEGVAQPAATQSEPVQEAVGQVAGSDQGGRRECPPPWKYSLKDMRIIWINMLLLTIAFLVLGIWLNMFLGESRPGWLNWFAGPVFWGIILVIPLVLWLYQLCKLVYRTTIKYDLDETRLIHKEGIFVAKTSVIELIRIDDMGATQSLVERFVCGGIGKVHVHSDDPGDPQLVLRGLEDHESVFRQIDQRRAEVRKKKAFVRA
jgi:hypothetical protein